MAEINITNAKTAWVSPVVYGALLIAIGVAMAIFHKDALRWILIITGVLMIIGNAIAIIAVLKEYHQVPIVPVVSLVIGIVLVLLPGFMADVAMVLLGISLVLYGIMSILVASAAAGKSMVHLIVYGAIGILSVGVGIYTFFNLNSVADITMIIIGVFTAFTGLIQVFGGVEQYRKFH